MITFVRVQPFKTRQNCFTSFRNRQKENGERLSTRKIIFFESFDAVKFQYTLRDAEQGEGGEGGI